MRGAGGTEGGIGRFFIGAIMIVGGGYLFLNAITVTHSFGFHSSIFSMGRFSFTTGMVLIPFIFGIGLIFYNAKNYLGWILSAASLIMLSFGIITNLNFRLRHMSLFELLTILVLLIGGIGLFLSSLKSFADSGE